MTEHTTDTAGDDTDRAAAAAPGPEAAVPPPADTAGAAIEPAAADSPGAAADATPEALPDGALPDDAPSGGTAAVDAGTADAASGDVPGATGDGLTAPVAESAGLTPPDPDASAADAAGLTRRGAQAPTAPAAEVTETPEPADDAAGTPEPTGPGADSSGPADAADTAEPAAETADTDGTPAADTAPPAADGTPAAPTASSVTGPAPGPAPRPVPRPVPRPTPRAPQAPVAAAAATVAPVAPPQDAAEAAHAATFGRVDEEGTVYVREGDTERVVGQFPGATAEEALGLYVRRFLDLQAKVVLFEARIGSADLPPKEVDQTLGKLTEELAEPAAVGDLEALRRRLEALRGVAAERRAAAEAERAAAKEAAVTARTAIVEQAEKIAGTDPERIQWRPAGEQLRLLLDQWKDAQRNGPRIDRPTEESLWKRFSHARTTFDRERRHFFAELESRNASARAAKETLVAEAERLATSTDWGATAGAYRDLMARWKASGRASRKEDDALWARFRGAQDAFFAARDAASAESDAEFRANLEVKEALLAEAERLVPVKDLAAAKSALRSIQDRWDAAGKVPRADLQRIEGRLRAVENAVRDADQSAWTRGNPETRARAEGAAAQLEAAIAGLEADLRAAQDAGDARRIADAQSALDARRAWLEQVRRAAEGS